MSKPRYDWWEYAKKIARKWKQLRSEYNDLHSQSITPNLSGMPVSGDVSRTIENIALRVLPGNKQREYDAACFALSEIMKQQDPKLRQELLRLVFWDNKKNIAGAAMKLGFSERTARRICWHYVLAIGRGMGFITQDEYVKSLKRDNN